MHPSVVCMTGLLLLETCTQPLLMIILIVFIAKPPPALFAPAEAMFLSYLVWFALGCSVVWLAWVFAYGQRRYRKHLLRLKPSETTERYILSAFILTACACMYAAVLALGLFATKFAQLEHPTVQSLQSNWDDLEQYGRHSYLCHLQEKYNCSGWSTNCTSSYCPVDCKYNDNPTLCDQTRMFWDMQEVFNAVPKWGIAFATIAGVHIGLGVVCLVLCGVYAMLVSGGCVPGGEQEEGAPLLHSTKTEEPQL
eukprot:TRINITY_DN52688_c0_g1_i1.p1 TRINITY_DN52688_c0_g1~~TRINITY_DN52688_c0_g1_i1.p1  ORF type:complete len:252 (-),score=3.15 TRINITY_DN52688_c0_g1_i1:45-800(-)